MIITVSENVLDLIKRVEEQELDDSGLDLNFSWSYYEDGQGASGQSWVDYPHAQYEVYVSSKGTSVTVQSRKLGKYDNDSWETHPLDSDYEDVSE